MDPPNGANASNPFRSLGVFAQANAPTWWWHKRPPPEVPPDRQPAATSVPITEPRKEHPFMSDVTQLAEGKLSAPQFVTKVVGEIVASPILKAMAPLALAILEPAIAKAIGSSSFATALIADITAGIEGGSPAATASAGLV